MPLILAQRRDVADSSGCRPTRIRCINLMMRATRALPAALQLKNEVCPQGNSGTSLEGVSVELRLDLRGFQRGYKKLTENTAVGRNKS